MKFHFSLISLIILCASMPLAVQAEDTRLYAGTDHYLREEVGLTEEQLSRNVDTVNREAFDLTLGEQTIADPLGDVLASKGSSAQIQIPWADIRSAELKKNLETQTWDISITTGGILPSTPLEKAQYIFYADRDADTTNNGPTGIKINVDAEFSVQYNPNTRAWETDFRWYNPDPIDFWAVDKDTAMTYAFDGDTIFMSIPFAEISSEIEPHWRVVVAATDGGKTQVDAAPGIGFPPPKGETYPEATYEISDSDPSPLTLVILLVIAVLLTLFGIRRIKTVKDS